MIKSLLIILLFSGCALFEPEHQVSLTILHTNDHHGHYLADKRGQYGMAARSTLLKKLRAEFKEKKIHNLLLSGGDINTGTMESDLFDAKPDFLGMKELGYDAMAVGNHEFDNSFAVIKQQKKWGGFPFLSANTYYKGTNKRVFDPLYIIKNFDGIKVAIFGLTAGDTSAKASHEDAKNLFEFKNIVESAKDVMQALKKENPDIVIAVTHVGHEGSLTAKGDVDLARNVDGIDIIVGGHSQEIINAVKVNNTIVVQAEDWGKYVGRLDLKIGKNGFLRQKNYQLIPVNLKKKVDGKYVFVDKEIKKDKKLVDLFAPFKKKAEDLSKKVVGTLDKTLDGSRSSVRRNQMPLGQFVGAAILDKIPAIEVAVVNGGALRNSLEKGKINRKKLHALHPYGNTIAYVKVSSRELYDYLQHISVNIFNARKLSIGGYPQLTGVKLTFGSDEKIKRIDARDGKWSIVAKKDGTLESEKKSFVLGTMNFLARGGDQYPVIKDKPSYVDTGYMINTAIMDYVEKRKRIKSKNYFFNPQDILVFE